MKDHKFTNEADIEQSKEPNPNTSLLLEANKQLAQYSSKASSHGRAEMVQDLRSKVDVLAKQVRVKDAFSAR